MQLIFEGSRARWEAITKYGEPAMGLPRAAGFQWDRSVTRWHHGDALAALKLRDYADEGTQAKLDAAAEVARVAADIKAHAAAKSVMASRATDAAIALPIAEGRAFLPYQRAGIAYALARPNVLIGDDMGLGKTLETIGVINADQELRKILIVCPTSLSRNWVREFGMFGSRPLTIGIATMKAVPATDIVVCTYDVFSRSTEASRLILATTWDCMVLDEAHYCKNRDAKRTHVILGGGRRGTGDYRPGIQVTKRRLYLTGTPIGNRPIELWPLIHSLAPAEFGNMMAYAKRYCDATCGRFGWDLSGSSNLDELQDKLRSLFMLRRLKKDVLAELPAKRRQIIELPADTPALRAVLKLEMETGKRNESNVKRLRAAVTAASDDPAAYEAAVAALRKGEQIAFSEISKVRHQTAIAKAPVVAAHVREAVEAGGKIIIFAHHQDVVDHLCAALADLGVVSVTGGTPPAKRQEVVDRFQTHDAIRVFVGNIQAAGVGITLTASAHVIFAELDWVPGAVSQAEDRAHRLGQLCSVLVQHLVLEGSIDCKMAATLTEKQKVLDAALDTVECDEARDDRLAAVQADMDAEIAAAQADAKAREAAAEDEAVRRAEQEARRAEVNAALNAIRTAKSLERASRASAERAASIARKAAKLGHLAPPSAEANRAIHGCLRLLKADDADRAEDQNGVGFNKADTDHGHYLAGLDALSEAEAIVGRALVRRYRRQLPADMVAQARGVPIRSRVRIQDPLLAVAQTHTANAPLPSAGDVIANVDAEGCDTSATSSHGRDLLAVAGASIAKGDTEADLETLLPEVPETAPEAVARKPGRPSLGATAMTQTERTNRYRASRQIVGMGMPQAVADRIRTARDQRGVTTQELLAEALDLLSGPGCGSSMAA